MNTNTLYANEGSAVLPMGEGAAVAYQLRRVPRAVPVAEDAVQEPAVLPDGERFFQALRDLHDAELLRQLDEVVLDLTKAVLQTGGKGFFALKVQVAKLGKERQVAVKPTVSKSIPMEETRQRLVWADDSGRFCEQDPAQGVLDFDAPRKVMVN